MNIHTNVYRRTSRIVAGAVLAIVLAGFASTQPQLTDPGTARLAARGPTLGICYQRGLPYTCRTIRNTRGGAARALHRAGYTVRSGH